MAGIHFAFDNFKQLMALSLRASDGLDVNHAQSVTHLCSAFRNIDEKRAWFFLSTILEPSNAKLQDENVLHCLDRFAKVD